MKSCLIGVFLFISGVLAADFWIPGQPITPGASTGVQYNVKQTYFASQQKTVAVWADFLQNTGPFPPFFSVFDGTAWTTGAPIPSGASTGVLQDIYLAYDAARQTVVAAWADAVTLVPYYSIFNGTSWTVALPIPLGSSTGVLQDVQLAYDDALQIIVAAWGDATGSFPAYYAIFDGITWTTPGLIPLGSSNGVLVDVSLVYDPVQNFIFAAWGDSLDPSIAYSIFDGTNWNTPPTFANLTYLGIQENVSLVFDAARQNIVAAWVEDDPTAFPAYAVFNGTTWTAVGGIPQGASIGAYLNVDLAYNPDSQTVFAAWAQGNSPYHPFFSIFNGVFWTTGLEIPPGASTGVDINVSLSYHLASHKMVAAWGNYPDVFLPYYSTYLTTTVLPPSDLIANTCKRAGGLTNVITWTPSPSSIAVNYLLRRDNRLIASIPAAGPFVFFDYNVCQNQTYIYTLTATNEAGDESLPITVTMRG